MDKVAGFVDYHLIQLLQWDHIYTANYFLALLALLGASLAACTTMRQWPMVRVARRWETWPWPQPRGSTGGLEPASPGELTLIRYTLQRCRHIHLSEM